MPAPEILATLAPIANAASLLIVAGFIAALWKVRA